MPEFGILPTHRAAPHRPDAQPVGHRRARPAARRGGSAAAVAAGMVPIAHGNDGGGSTAHPGRLLRARRPQAQPRARLARRPTSATRSSPADGVLTRTVAETAQLLDVLAGYELGDATWAPRPAEPYATRGPPRPGPAAHRA